MKTIVLAAIAAGAAMALFSGCSTPYSQLDGNRYHRVPIDTYPVIVTQVDGASYLQNPVLVEPGPRKITVQGPPTPTNRYGSTQAFDLDVKPCTRYYLVAVKRNVLANDFTVKVDHEDPITSCSATARASPPP